jgi:deferrochelatase/peroxidase EfeB
MARSVLNTADRGGPSARDFDDMQALVRFAHQRLTGACFYLLRIADAAAARAWLANAEVTSAAARNPPPETALQVGLTAEGLRALGVSASVIDAFSPEFREGLASNDDRSRRLGDVGANAPVHWRWGAGKHVPHLLVMAYAVPSRLQEWKDRLAGPVWDRAFSVIDCLDTSDMGGREPFGFVDGISQPAIDWDRQRQPTATESGYGNLVAPGEFVLGYRNEYDIYTDRPLLDPAADQQGLLPWAEDVPSKRDLGRNGTYLVLRDLQQDVHGFWVYIDARAAESGVTRQHLAEMMVGRTLSDGAPLASLSPRPIPGTGSGEDGRLNCFTFDDDASGTVCPLGTHIRRANPRTSDVPPGTGSGLSRLIQTLGLSREAPRDDLIASARFHRILRRGREYGKPLPPGDAHLRPSGEDVGLRFLALNANISRQFEFIQTAWLMSTKFNGLTAEGDPLLGNREPVIGCPVSSGFTWSRAGSIRRRLKDLPQFVTVRGGAYFFMPGLGALRYLSR